MMASPSLAAAVAASCLQKDDNDKQLDGATNENDWWSSMDFWESADESDYGLNDATTTMVNHHYHHSNEWGSGGGGAQHLVILMDCNNTATSGSSSAAARNGSTPSMWEPCMPSLAAMSQQQQQQQHKKNHNNNDLTPPPSAAAVLVSPIVASLQMCCELLQSKIKRLAVTKSGKRDGVGILLYNLGTSSSGSGTSSTTTRVLLPLEPPGIEQVKRLRKLLQLQGRVGVGVGDGTTTFLDNVHSALRREFGIAHDGTRLSTASTSANEQKVATDDGSSLSSLQQALLEADTCFSQAKCVKQKQQQASSLADSKSVWIFTNHDNPLCCTDSSSTSTSTDQERKRLYRAAMDVQENGVELYLWPMVGTTNSNKGTKVSSFDGDLFYNEMLTAPVLVPSTTTTTTAALPQEDGGVMKDRTDPNDDMESASTTTIPTFTSHLDVADLMENLQRHFVKVRTAFSVPMWLPNHNNHGSCNKQEEPDVGIQVDVYRTVQLQRKPQPVAIHQETKKPTIKVTQWMDDVTKDIVKSSMDTKEEAKARSDAHAVYTMTKFGNKPIVVTKEQVVDIKSHANGDQLEAGLKLLGFKPVDSLPMHYTLQSSLFLYPNESKIKGSKAAFANLHASMLRKGVVAIGELLTKATTTSRLVALYPQQAEYLPMDDDDVRDEDSDVRCACYGEQITPPGMVAIFLPFEDDVRALDPDSGTAAEASVQAAMAMMDRMKFGDDFGLDYFKNDSLSHFYTYMESIALETSLPVPERTLDQITDEDVRKQAGDQIDAFVASLPEDIVVVKEPKKRKRVPDESGCDWHALYKSDTLDECTVVMLKQYLKSVGEKCTGNKPQLVERVSQSIGARLKSGELQHV